MSLGSERGPAVPCPGWAGDSKGMPPVAVLPLCVSQTSKCRQQLLPSAANTSRAASPALPGWEVEIRWAATLESASKSLYCHLPAGPELHWQIAKKGLRSGGILADSPRYQRKDLTDPLVHAPVFQMEKLRPKEIKGLA